MLFCNRGDTQWLVYRMEGNITINWIEWFQEMGEEVEAVLNVTCGSELMLKNLGRRRASLNGGWRNILLCCLKPTEDEVQQLDYQHCGLNDVPAEVFSHERTLEMLNLDCNQINDLPRPLFHCHGLKQLSLSDNEVAQLPHALASLIHLQVHCRLFFILLHHLHFLQLVPLFFVSFFVSLFLCFFSKNLLKDHLEFSELYLPSFAAILCQLFL